MGGFQQIKILIWSIFDNKGHNEQLWLLISWNYNRTSKQQERIEFWYLTKISILLVLLVDDLKTLNYKTSIVSVEINDIWSWTYWLFCGSLCLFVCFVLFCLAINLCCLSASNISSNVSYYIWEHVQYISHIGIYRRFV